MSQLIRYSDNHSIDSSVLTFGNFDGVHLGHNKLINSLITKSKETNSKSILLTFNPHTREILDPNGCTESITPYRIKTDILNRYNLDYIITIDFDFKFSKI